jgi:hypothetical protein
VAYESLYAARGATPAAVNSGVPSTVEKTTAFPDATNISLGVPSISRPPARPRLGAGQASTIKNFWPCRT